ncbi:hypothetical protein J2R98_002916 [Alkalibacillus filiformis]|uniref:Colicin V production protein n=1 Tax=Alkalibacillus filiformis TaxID=200990 RepID=A0ABU0DX76_9BACI|nr:hypothetical protein [Alkalibacillus filiformis]MDQ0353055.1 hypothetical protein [Alkalibacillus filiformis]
MGEVELFRLVLILFVLVAGVLIARFYDKWWATPIVTVILYYGAIVFYQLFVPGIVRLSFLEAVIFLAIISVILDVAIDRIWKYKVVPITLTVILVFLGGVLFYIEQSKHTTMEQVIADEYGEEFEIERLEIDRRINRTNTTIEDEELLREWHEVLNDLEVKRQEGWPRVDYILDFNSSQYRMELDEYGNIYVDRQNYYIFNPEEVYEFLENEDIEWED